MVFSVGTGRMAIMARLLEAGSFSQNVAGYVGDQKLVAQNIRKEIFEADEPNLLDEEDMHVFGLKPMDDPLHLVCCNACKKPVKASHYAVHADICRLLTSTEDDDVDHSTEHRKPPQKQRGKVLSVYANEIAQKQETLKLMDANGSTGSETYMDGGLGSFPKAAKAGDIPRYTLSQSEKSHNAVGHTFHGYLHCNHVRYQVGIPAPLATKIYYSQRNNHLRSAINNMFKAVETEEPNNTLNLEAIQLDTAQPEVLSQRVSPPGQKSNASLMTARKGKPANILWNQPSVGEALRQESSFAMPRSTDIPVSSVSNSGTMLDIVQQSNGGAPCTDSFAERSY